MLYLVSSASLASENCNKELAKALNGRIRTVSVIYLIIVSVKFMLGNSSVSVGDGRLGTETG